MIVWFFYLFQVVDYNETAIVEDVKALAQAGKKVWVTFVCNYAIFSAIPEVTWF